MKEKTRLRTYLIGGVLLMLLAIGILQLIIAGILNISLIPYMEQVLGLEGLLTNQDYGTLLSVIFKSLIIVLIWCVAGSTTRVVLSSDSILVRFFGEELLDRMGEFGQVYADGSVIKYVCSILLFLIFLLVIWLTPYILGAIFYSRIVNSRINELEAQRVEREKEYARKRNLLLSDMAHDIRTPVTTVAGFSRALADGTVPEELRQDYLNSVYEKSMRVSDLVNLLFDYVKLDSDGYVLRKNPCDFSEIVRGCVAVLYADFEDKDMEVDLNIPETPICVNADKVHMERAINNLLINTIRHNPPKTKVFIEVEIEAGMAVLKISDLGVRIDKDIAMHLFEPFVQGDESRSSKAGSGLGLSISKKIVEMHSGQLVLIQYKNVEKNNKVKTFRISLPMVK